MMKENVEKKAPVSCAVLLSGSGSNAEALLRYERAVKNCPYHVTLLVTDAPETSRAAEIASDYGLPLVGHDIKKFYFAHGEDSIKMDSPYRRELRDLWSEELYKKIMDYSPAFVCFAGFIPLSNIARHLPCLNVHPGDLTRCNSQGERIYAGLHVLPVENAILNGDRFLRSSVILVQPYTGNGTKEMDAGPILGISTPLPVDLGGHSLEELAQIRQERVKGVPCRDKLRTLALEHIDRLKTAGDHIVFPRAAADFAAGLFKTEREKLFYCGCEVISVEYSNVNPPRMLLKDQKH